ncbi:MAG: TetR/AcrR family transcriptional regulator [Propionibacteriaceae bacterium]|nr:TetR/AcrR family transcriptional regulator [Propionibacteriaceae bacterium]
MSPTGTGRPRDASVEPRVREAVLKQLVEHGYPGLRIEDVARSSGVAKTTIYRRWPSLDALVLDAMGAALGDRTVQETEDPLADLLTLVRVLHHSLVENPLGWSLPGIGLSVAQDPELGPDYRRRFITPLREQALALLGRAAEQGLVPAGIPAGLLVDAVAGSFVFRRLAGEEPPSLAELEALVTALTRPES